MGQEMFRKYSVLFATSLVLTVLGSIHAFSVFLEPLEAKFGVTRATASLAYSFGLVFLTGAVLAGPFIYNRMRPAMIFVVVSFLCALGTIMASFAGNIAMIWLGYSVLFGFANGLGYGFGLQLVARTNPQIAGLAMGIVTAAYALGATISSFIFEATLAAGGFRMTMLALGATVFIVGLIAAFIIAKSGASYSVAQQGNATTALPIGKIALLWLSYGAAVFAGLMVIGHAASIAKLAGFSGWAAPSVLAIFNLSGSLISGGLTHRVSHRRLLVILPLISAASLVAMMSFQPLVLICLGIVGFSFGGIIAVYPAAISRMFKGEDGPRAYGRVFTAWGMAGLLGPWIAGRIFDLSSGYQAALVCASVLAVISAFVAMKSIKADVP